MLPQILLLAGVALCALSVLVAVIQLAQTQAPRGAAILFVFGIAAMLAGAWLNPEPFEVTDIGTAWTELIGGQSAP